MARNVSPDETELISADSKYRNFVQQVDKALRSFECTSEWADLVSALGKLNKIIPRRYMIGQRLAQCMHPALPSGVHLKALETYDLIFKIIGNRLVQELGIYSNGLFPLLCQAAINVKPTLIEIYENHFLPLGKDLKPCLDGFIIAVLPGLEEGSEYHDSTDRLLQGVCDQVGNEFFYGSLWKCILSNPNVRLPAVSFIVSHYNKKKKLEEQLFIMGNDRKSLVYGICISLLDTNILVQRAILDLLITCFPLSQCKMNTNDITLILTAGFTVLLRRDTSLNRRLDSWLFGLEVSGQTFLPNNKDNKKLTTEQQSKARKKREKREQYFSKYTKEYCLSAFILSLSNPSQVIPFINLSTSLGEIWPYKLLLCVFDYFELMNSVLDSLCVEIFRALYFDLNDQRMKQDSLKFCNILISNLGVNYLWHQFSKLFSEACQRKESTNEKGILINKNQIVRSVGSCTPDPSEILVIMDFFIEITSVESFPDSIAQYLPANLSQILNCLDEYFDKLNPDEMRLAILLLIKMVSKILPCPQYEVSKDVGKTYDCLSDIKEECESLTSEIIKSSESVLNNIFLDKQIDQINVPISMQKLVRELEKFFSNVIRRKLVSNSHRIEDCFVHLIKFKNIENQPKEIDIEVNGEYVALYSELCELLIKTSLIITTEDKNSIIAQNDFKLSNWLKEILILSIYPTDMEVNYCSIRTVLKLMNILKCQLLELPVFDINDSSPSSSPILSLNKIVNKEAKDEKKKLTCIDFMITQIDIQNIYLETGYFLRITEILWNNLEEEKNFIHFETANLIQQVHNLVEDSEICENVICNSMRSTNESIAYEARKKFCILFNITRNLKPKLLFNQQTSIREFDKPIFFMLDSLTHKLDSHNVLSVDWLTHCVNNGDIARILEPLLVILLHPDTHRVSIQNMNIQQSETSGNRDKYEKDSEIAMAESKIFAISHDCKNIVYHVNPEGKKKFISSPLQRQIINPNETLKSSSKKWSNFKPNASDYEISHQDGLNNKHLSINMFLNPFGSISSLDSFVENPSQLATDSKTGDSKKIIKTLDEKRSISSQKFWKDSDSEIIANLVEELIDIVVEKLETKNDEEDCSLSSDNTIKVSESLSMLNLTKPISISQLHSHILLYVQIYDSKRTFYALTTLWNVILVEPQKMLFTLATTSISNRKSVHTQELLQFFGRHKKSLTGKCFYGELISDLINSHKNSSFLEIIITTCLYYVRSYYPSLVQNKSSDDEIYGNQKVRILSCEILKLIFSELISAIKNRQTFSNYVHDMLNRCNVQKYILHTIVSSVYNFQIKSDKKIKSEDVFSENLIDFNEKTGSHDFQEDMQKSLLKLLEQLMILEYRSSPIAGQNEKTNRDSKKENNDSRASKIRFQPQMSSLKYVPNAMIPAQSMFLSAIQTSLQQTHKSNLHSNWLTLIEATLPIAHRSLTRIMVCIVTQLCHNLEDVSSKLKVYSAQNQKNSILQPNYLIVLLKSFSNLLHHCLLDLNSNHVVNQITQSQQSLSKNLSTSTSSLGPFQAITNFFHTISPGETGTDSSSNHHDTLSTTNSESMLITRKSILSHLPKILSAVLKLWKVINELESFNSDKQNGWQIMGSIKDLRQQILNLLSPISLIHGPQFLASIAILWHELKDKNPNESKRNVVPNCSSNQKHLVNLIASIRVLAMDSVFQQIKQVMKTPPQNIQFRKKRVPLEVCMLQFSLCYIKEFSGEQLLDCWKSLLNLLKDGSQIASSQPLVQFHLLAILHEFVQISPYLQDRKDQKDLQDVSQKLIDACVTVASGRLGQTRWLRRNLEVKPGPQYIDHDEESELELDENKFDSTSYNVNNEITMAKYSVQALNALAQFVAPVLDVVYVSEEKEKVIPLVSNIMYYVTPYLRNHSKHNAPSFYSCSDLLSSISGYQYLRKAWRKDAFELLLEPNFFQMEVGCLCFWRTVTDHLMTHDKTTFGDFLQKMSVPIAGAGLNKLFSSKEQENDLRAQLTKRLAFILFCSEKDQYMKYMSEIQEKIIEFLRVNSSSTVLSNIFLCFRVLILRMSSHQLTSLWPFIYTELSQIFLQIENELLRNYPNNEISYLSNNGSNNAGNLQLYLQACKFLDLAISLPADCLPQFQLDKWSFISSVNNGDASNVFDANNFEPQLLRIEKLMRKKNPNPKLLPYKRRSPLLNQTEISDLMSLHSFFYTLLKVEGNQTEEEKINESDRIFENCFRNNKMAEQLEREHEKAVDELIELDFVEPLQN